MSEQDDAVEQAKAQYERQGYLTVNQFIALTDAGCDADAILEQLENGDL